MAKIYRLNRTFPLWLAHHFKEFFLWYAGAVLSLYLLQRLQVELPLLVKTMTDGKAVLNIKLASIFLLIALGIFTFRTLSRLLFFYPARVQQKLLRGELVEALESTHPKLYEQFPSGQIYQMLYNDINNLRAFVGFALLQVGNVVIAGLVLFPTLSAFDPYVLKTLTPMIVAMMIFSLIAAFTQRWSKKASESQGKVQQFLMETYTAKATIKNFHREDDFVAKFKEACRIELNFFLKSSLSIGLTFPLIKLGLGFSLLWGALVLVSQGKGASDVIFYSSFLFLMLEPLMFLSWIAVVTAQGLAAWRRIKELWVRLTPKEREVTYLDLPKEIKLDVPFWEKLMDLHFTQSGWMIFAGPTGCGKSQLLNKMAQWFKDHNYPVSLVTQEPFMFNDTLEGNIFLGKTPSVDERKLAQELLTLFGLRNLVTQEADLLSLMVGENGKRLSGGEKKRVALVRSLLSDAKVFLWDDPFSAVDVIFERKILESLKMHPRFKVALFILTSHRLTTIKECDDLFMLDPKQGLSLKGPVKELLIHPMVKEFFHEQMV
jgi:ABC-type multidrug transport system fused ATPase/permease subunit